LAEVGLGILTVAELLGHRFKTVESTIFESASAFIRSGSASLGHRKHLKVPRFFRLEILLATKAILCDHKK
jgi:hypothetical protein